jgi:L,D-transpeptidase YcbB
MRMTFRSLLLPATLVLFLLGCGTGPPAAQVTDSLRTDLAARGAVGGEPLIEGKAVRAFYEGRQNRPAWSAGAEREIVQAIQGISADGLTPAHYHLEAIEKLERDAAASAKAAAELDLLLTDAVAAMADHLRYGKVRPVTLQPSWNVDPRQDAPPLEETIAKIAASGSPAKAIAAQRPQHFIYRGLMDALARAERRADQHAWRPVAEGKSIRPGELDRRIPLIRARLWASADLAGATPARRDSTRYDPALVRAVKTFQERHRQDPHGVIDRDVIAALNVPPQSEADQLRVNLERARWVVNGLGDDFLLVNLPAFKAYLIRGGRNVWEARTQIGDEAKQTPTFRAQMRTIVFNPDWTVPPMILAEEVLPAMQRGENYLAEKKLVVLDQQNREVDPSTIDWRSATAESFPYTLRQPPDEENALGKVKFLFPNPYSIYLHDTPARTLFNAEKRTFSHGCIRMERPVELAQLLLENQDGWDAAKIQQTIDGGEKVNVNLERPMPVLIVYWTVSVGASGIHTMQDFYDLDPPLLSALNQPPG